MLDSQTIEALRPLGLTASVLAHIRQHLTPRNTAGDALLGRAIEVQRDRVAIATAAGPRSARLLPSLLQQLRDDELALAVGDWLLAAADPSGQTWVHARVPPLNQLSRRDPEGQRQPLVSNVDLALLVMGLDHDFKLARLDRYLVLTHAAGVPALVVLTKADQCADPGAALERVRSHLGRIDAVLDIVAVDGTRDAARAALAPWLAAGQTLVLLGSSGAGKSTLTNTLCEAQLQGTGGVRLDDSRGRHTTTARSLHRARDGACIIDTPGLRGLQLDATAAELDEAFEDVTRLAAACRFRNCSHAGEPGCAVQAALNPARLKSWQKLQREAARESMSWEQRRERLAQWKAMGRAVAVTMRHKRGE